MLDEQASRYRVRVDTVIPAEGGGTVKLLAGQVVSGGYYSQFLKTGFLVELPPEDAPPSAATSRPEPPAEPPTEPEIAGVLTREELESRTKAELQAIAPGVKGSKAELIEHILAEETDAEEL